MPVKLYAFVVAYVHNGKGVLFHSTGHYEYTYENTEFQANAQEHVSQHGESFHTLLFGLILIDAQRYFKSSLVNRKNVKKPFAHESLENPLSCVSKCASENFHTLLFGLILNQATALLQFMMA